MNKKEFDRFTKIMWKRLVDGEKKYGIKYKTAIISQEMLCEAADLSNYSYLLYLKAKKYTKRKK
jgi:hypothetical protein